MGQIIKYNVVKSEDSGRTETVGIGVGSIISGGGGNGDNNNGGGTNIPINVNCSIWGQPLNGADDITGTLTISDGDLYVKKKIDNDDEEDWDEDDGEEEEGEEELTDGGNVYIEGSSTINENLEVKQRIKAAATEAKETYGETLFVNYPKETDAKTNVADLINALDIRIKKIEKEVININNEISDINNELTDINGDISYINNKLTAINNNVTGITTIIGNMQQQIDNLDTTFDNALNNINDRLQTIETQLNII